ncbi:MAG TPA: hypothetical protein VMF11_04340 [Candidatus Baltobacteraceae bacterium]|nr:hypothetical protein [Candidatus Baltobacteraceae bacterium]
MPRKRKTDFALMPEEDLKKVVQGLLQVSKDDLDRAEAERPKRKRAKKS